MEFLILILFIVAVICIIRAVSTSAPREQGHHKSYKAQPSKPVKDVACSMGAYFILDEIIDGNRMSANSNQSQHTVEDNYDVDTICEDCGCDDFEFFE